MRPQHKKYRQENTWDHMFTLKTMVDHKKNKE